MLCADLVSGNFVVGKAATLFVHCTFTLYLMWQRLNTFLNISTCHLALC